jgi:hypothetical protein
MSSDHDVQLADLCGHLEVQLVAGMSQRDQDLNPFILLQTLSLGSNTDKKKKIQFILRFILFGEVYSLQ